jgi:predicted nucleotidyltransferase component of viral defense system
MTKALTNIPASIKAKLLNLSQKRGLDYNHLLTQYAIERLLYRLSISEHRNRFLLKGAQLFLLWEGAFLRPTRDLDLLGFGDVSIQFFVNLFREITAEVCYEDGIIFDSKLILGEEIRAHEEYVGVRLTLKARLDTIKLTLQVDIGTGDAVTPPAKEVIFPTILDLPKPTLRAYQVETVVSEKFHAIVKLGLQNTRMKDYLDLFHILNRYSFDGALLARAIRETFERRGTKELPLKIAGLTEEFFRADVKRTQWESFLRKNPIQVSVPNFAILVTKISDFILPVVACAFQQASSPGSWEPPGPWQLS